MSGLYKSLQTLTDYQVSLLAAALIFVLIYLAWAWLFICLMRFPK
jgi:hypothetical protein